MNEMSEPTGGNSLKASYMRGKKMAGGGVGMKGGMMKSLNIRRADNGGFTVECSYELPPEKESKGQSICSRSEYKTSVFTDMDDAMEFIEEALEEMGSQKG